MTRNLLLLLALLLTLAPRPVQAQKKVLGHEAYDVWRTIDDEQISPDGAWVFYRLAPRVGDAELVVTSPGGVEHRVPRVGAAQFSPDSRFVLFTITPAHDSVRRLELAETPEEQMPPDTLGILDLRTERLERVPGVDSWKVPEDGPGVVAYALKTGDIQAAPEDSTGAAGPGNTGFDAKEQDESPDEEGRSLVLRQLGTAEEFRFSDATSYEFSRNGSVLAFTVDGPAEGNGSRGTVTAGVRVVWTESGRVDTVMTGPGRYEQLAVEAEGERVAFLSDRADPEGDHPQLALYVWARGDARATALADSATPGIPGGWWVSEHGELTFSESGRRVFFGTAPRPAPAAEDTLLEEEKVRLDVWHWQDPLIQPMQLERLEEERERTYTAVALLDRDRVVQLGTPEMPEVEVGSRGDADVALAETAVPYRGRIGIEAPGYSDLWLIDVLTGERRRVAENRQVAWAALSPGSRYVAWYDYGERHWLALPVGGQERVNLTEHIPFPVWEVEADRPMSPGPYGAADWTEGDEALLVYDRYDVWAVDPERPESPQRITDGFGRENRVRLRPVDLDPEERALDPSSPLLLSAFDLRTKEAGFYRDRISGDHSPERLVYASKRFSRPERAEEADVLLYTREDVAEFPDLWMAGLAFRDPVRVSRANPQQEEYKWATVELVEWLSSDGERLQGLLYRPEDFDPSQEYPMMVYFYERNSDNLHAHAPPLPHRSIVRPTFYASRGYLVFIPDITYEAGYPGESAMDAVMPGVLRLAEQPWVDEHNIGVQGHSWGGYQIAYMVTQTDFFKAAGAGAPVANMTSAYGGVRWGSGMSRMFQYENTQSRIGGTLWEQPLRYIENSPLFYLDEVETPLLIMHNDEDGAVPWYQGIELFLALRRLGKPAWLINYNDQPHWPVTAANIRDWNIRMQQYFDHFLKGAPAPVWLAEGIPAVEKGRTLGLEPADSIGVREAAEAPGTPATGGGQ